MIICPYLPEEIICDDITKWDIYEEKLFQVFRNEFIENSVLYKDKQVKIRFNPITLGRPEGFYHVTTKHYDNSKERYPDPNRCRRIKWTKAIIEKISVNCNTCKLCNGIKIWRELYKNNNYRIYFLFQDEMFLVIIEERGKYYLLITAIYIDYKYKLNEYLRKYEDAVKAGSAL